jgi:hypothetical protein
MFFLILDLRHLCFFGEKPFMFFFQCVDLQEFKNYKQ